MTIEVLAYVVEGWRPLYLIDVKKFDKEDNTIPVDGYAEVTDDWEVTPYVIEFEDEQYQKVNRDFIIRAKRLKGDEWKNMKYKFFRIDE